MTPRLPVTIVAGFLGAGKTTLVNRLLAATAGRRVAVLVNDFGAVNIDERLIATRSSTVVSLTNGCVCCSIQGDLVAQLGGLLDDPTARFDMVVIETSGVSEPGRIALSVGYPQLRERVALGAVVTVVDASRCLQLEGEARRLADEQLAAADVALLNKIDLPDPAALLAVREACRAVGVRVVESAYAELAPELLLGLEAGSADARSLRMTAVGGGHGAFEHRLFESAVPFVLRALRRTLRTLPEGVLRAKGFVHVHELPDTEVVVQVVGSRVELTPGKPWAGPPRSTLVFIGLRDAMCWPLIAARLSDSLVAQSTAEPVRAALAAGIPLDHTGTPA